MNNFEEYAQSNNDDNYMNGMGELNTETLNAVDNEESGKLSADDLLADGVKNTTNTNVVFDEEGAYESHFTPYEGLFSDSAFDFE